MRPFAVVLLLACTACIEPAPSELSEAVLDCEFGRAPALRVGAFLQDSAGGARFCLEAPEGGTFALVPFVAGARDTAARVTASVYGGGLTSVSNLTDLQRTQIPRIQIERLRLVQGNDAWHVALRARENREYLALRTSAATRAQLAPAARTHSAAVPVPGDMLTLNVSTSCDVLDRRNARVIAVTSQAIVAWDPGNPTGARTFSDEDLRTFGREFDQLIYPTITQNFGTATDIDQNGRVILYFTRAVNEIPIPGSPAALAIGFFYRGDVLPRAGIPNRTAPCPQSNEGEVLYLAVPDSLGEVRGVPVSYTPLHEVMTGTIAHELQHMINAARRVHITSATDFEETWLNEGLSHIAEELMFYAASGLTPGQNVDTTAILLSNSRINAYNRYMFQNLKRFEFFLQSPHDWSLMGTDGSATRGAAWSFLRYAADRDPRADGVFFRALIDGPAVGLNNLRVALGQDPLAWMQDWSVSVIADDFVPGLDARFQQPSWNLRNLIAAIQFLPRYPLRVLPIEPGSPGFSVRLRPGGAAYPVFAVKTGDRAFVSLGAEGETTERRLRAVLMRLK
jgi:hypothetical protein